jgi:hypothetical protein
MHGCGIRYARLFEPLMKSVTVQRSLALHLPLRRLALCLDCEACFDIGTPSGPACSGDTWIPLARFLDQRPLRLLPQFHPFPKGRKESPKALAKQMLVVARDRENLYGYLKRAFASNPTVEVVLDRRRTERRNADRARTPERRRGDCRVRLDIDNQLRALGWAVVRLDVFRTAGLSHLNASH